MGSMRTKHPPAFKAKVALEAFKEEKTSAELARQYQVHPGLIRNWKALLIKGAPELFNSSAHSEKDQAELVEQLHKKIGTLEVELDWLKKNLDLPRRQRRMFIDRNGDIPLSRQAELLGISHVSLYYEPVLDDGDERL